VPIEKGGEKHRADIVHSSGRIIKLQQVPLLPAEIRSREAFFGLRRMLWLFDVRDATVDGPYGPRLDLRAKSAYHTFRWKHPKKHIAFAKAPVLLDLGTIGIFSLGKLHIETGAPYGGWGKLSSRESFVVWLTRKSGEYKFTCAGPVAP
jgi:hypothetical protein